jgi:hypothetical protein
MSVVICVLLVGLAAGGVGLWVYFNTGFFTTVDNLWAHVRYGLSPQVSSAGAPGAPSPVEPPVEPNVKKLTAAKHERVQPKQPVGGSGGLVVEAASTIEVTIPSFSTPIASEPSAVVQLAPAPQPQKAQKVVYAARHKHRSGGCDGVLTLTPDGFAFDSHEHSLTLAASQVRQLDGDGFTDSSGKSWRFSIKGADARAVLQKWKDGALFR